MDKLLDCDVLDTNIHLSSVFLLLLNGLERFNLSDVSSLILSFSMTIYFLSLDDE